MNNQHDARKLFFDCGHVELKPLDATEYRQVRVDGPCGDCRGKTATSEFDRVFADLEAPDYPATCDQCGEAGTNASMEGHVCGESPASQAGERDTWTITTSQIGGYVWSGKELIAACGNPRHAQLITADHNQHATLIEQRERLVDLLRYLKDTAFAVHVNDKHKPEAFAICEHMVCQRACQAWNEYLEKIAAATIEQGGEASR